MPGEAGAGPAAPGEAERLRAELEARERELAEALRHLAAKERALGEQQALLAEQGAEILALSERVRAFEQGGALPPVLPLRYRLVDRLNDAVKRAGFLRRLHARLKAWMSRRPPGRGDP